MGNWNSISKLFIEKTGTCVERLALRRIGETRVKKVITLGEMTSLKQCGLDKISVSYNCGLEKGVKKRVALDGTFIINGAEKHHISGLTMEEFAAYARGVKKSGQPIPIDIMGNNMNNRVLLVG